MHTQLFTSVFSRASFRARAQLQSPLRSPPPACGWAPPLLHPFPVLSPRELGDPGLVLGTG